MVIVAVAGNASAETFARYMSAYNINTAKFFDDVGRYAIEEYCERKKIPMHIVGTNIDRIAFFRGIDMLVICVKSPKDLSKYKTLIMTADSLQISSKIWTEYKL